MRALLISSIAMFATTALAQEAPERPSEAAPQATASFEAREAWCLDYAHWFVATTPAPEVHPADVAPNHRFEVELNSCKLDPQAYERDTLAEIAQSAEEQVSG
jgi:hypothetical protein